MIYNIRGYQNTLNRTMNLLGLDPQFWTNLLAKSKQKGNIFVGKVVQIVVLRETILFCTLYKYEKIF
jgi:hypothetical protein